uniref:Uncharacterized protein LOC113789985 n=1 Tax=Dermatophagoides pteronyssinus TaxID=6956 RepID=A0A6P6XPP3_DERPT|nr:uncharacterized protein LOC113789985 [Dermatophagoides pteronyssinus]
MSSMNLEIATATTTIATNIHNNNKEQSASISFGNSNNAMNMIQTSSSTAAAASAVANSSAISDSISGQQQQQQLNQLNMNNNYEFSPMIFRSMSDASAIRRNQLMNPSSSTLYNRQQQQQQLNNLYGPSWSNVEQQQQQYSHLDLMTIISPENLLSTGLSSAASTKLSTGSRMMSLMNRNSFLQQQQDCDQMFNNNSNMNGFTSSTTSTSSLSSPTALASSSSSTTTSTISTSTTTTTGTTINGQLRLINNKTTDDDDYDLNIVFDEIGALQHKGLNEPEDDNSTAPLQLLSPSQQQSSLTTTISTAMATTTTIINDQQPKKQLTQIEIDGKIYKYDSDLYDPSDITLSNEKYSMNARYLRDFRCEQCPLFLQHKCTQHKPFTCFHWHFANQRRRRPLRKRDGTFNYSPDNYCTKYDDTTGICPDGDDCPCLHRTAGDTERRYHLRYYKTGMCVYETDERGYCVKNGAHCAFAHGSHDLRMAVFDIREQQQQQQTGTNSNNGIGNIHCDNGVGINGVNQNDLINNGDHLMNGCTGVNCCQTSSTTTTSSSSTQHMFDKDRNAIHEDPRWQNTAFVLAYYKTESCKRPPRVCRQGYACPQYHNNKDRRRSPKKFKYRSTPCPSVKQGDEWGDPNNCENQDDCIYCHTRTEQQFHPEIYKSTKCNDIQQSGHCPRGPFCAFAHSENSDEINMAKEFATNPNTELPPPSNNNNTIGSTATTTTTSTTTTTQTCKSNINHQHNHHPHSQQQHHQSHHHHNQNNNNTSPMEIVRANSYSRGSSSSSSSITASATSAAAVNNSSMIIASSLPEHVEFGGYDLNAQQQQLRQMAQNELQANNNNNSQQNQNNILGPIARPRSFSTSNTTKTSSSSSLLANWLDSKNSLLQHQKAAAALMNKNVQQQQQQQQQSLFSTASSCSSLFSGSNVVTEQQPVLQNGGGGGNITGPFSTNSLYEPQQQSSTAFDSMLNNHDLSSFDELDNFVTKTANAIDNCHLTSSSTSSSSALRRGSYSFNESEPINIPRITNNNNNDIHQHRSTSASGFNLSPPNHQQQQQQLNAAAAAAIAAAAAAASPIGSTFLASRQQSLPNNHQSLFDQYAVAANLNNVNGTTNATTNQQQSQSNVVAISAAIMEMQRLKEENNAAKNRIVESQETIQQVLQWCHLQLNEAQKREKLAEKRREEALSMLNMREKELEIYRTNESNSFQKRLQDLSTMSQTQLLQLKQKLSQDLSCIEEALKTTSAAGNILNN